MTANEKRYTLIKDYPNCPYKIDEVLYNKAGIKEPNFANYSHLFQPLAWWEKRGLDELTSVRFCRIIKTNGYWREGDILPVIGYDMRTEGPHPIFKGYRLRGYNTNPECYTKQQVEPATEEEFLKWKAINKSSINP